MPARGPKRLYTRKALEAWFERLSDSWEDYFASEELAKGRDFYVEGGVREIELSEKDAIIHARTAKTDCYVLLEWENGRPAIRYSMEDRSFGYALAVAGLYEIDELVADECSGLEGLEEKKEATGTSAQPQAGEPPHTDERQPARPLIVAFTIGSGGLQLQAWWVQATAQPVPALGKLAERGPPITSAEREKLIALTRRAHKSGFVLQPDVGAYELRDWTRINPFVSQELPAWRRYFQVKNDPQLALLSRGVQLISADIEISSGTEGMVLQWQFRLGEQCLDRKQVDTILDHGAKPVFLPGLGLVKLPDEQADWLQQWHPFVRKNSQTVLPPYMLFSLFHGETVPVRLSAEMQEWKKTILQPPSPNGQMPDFLRPYQKRGVAWLAHLARHGCHGLLADEMGLGKTVQVLTLIASACPLPGSAHLIICPASVVPVWQRESARFFPHLSVEILRQQNDFVHQPKDGLWIASYTQLRRHRKLLEQIEFGYAVLDEAQFIKNPDAKISQACMAVRARHRLVLTGTPLENRQLDLWTLFRFLMPGLLGGRKQMAEQANRMPLVQAERLRRQIAPFVLRRTKAEVLPELPPKVESTLICPLTPLQIREYNRLAGEGLAFLGEEVKTALRSKAVHLFTLLTRLRQTCCDPQLLPWMKNTAPENSGKLLLLSQKAREILASGHKIVIFSQFVRLLERAEALLRKNHPEIPFFTLTGRTLRREEPVEAFQQVPGAAGILVSLRAGGTGITLHAADYVFLLDPWWNPAVEAQAVDRVHRIGQDKTVFVYRMVTHGTIEERIEQLKTSKRELFNAIVDPLNGDRGIETYFQSLRELVTLTAEFEEEALPPPEPEHLASAD